mgnify:CR=1 FL=1
MRPARFADSFNVASHRPRAVLLGDRRLKDEIVEAKLFLLTGLHEDCFGDQIHSVLIVTEPDARRTHDDEALRPGGEGFVVRVFHLFHVDLSLSSCQICEISNSLHVDIETA